jgi:uncharacterized protein (DUF1697 family)
MPTYIALFRGINVGGNNILPMKQLTTILESLGLTEVKTYIQSGNALFQCPTADLTQLGNAIATAINQHFGFKPKVLLLRFDELEQAVRSNPFPEAESQPNSLHVSFLTSAPTSPDLQTLATLANNGERFSLQNKAFYLHAPEGIARSKLAANAEKHLGVSTTSRNWRTVCKLLALTKP